MNWLRSKTVNELIFYLQTCEKKLKLYAVLIIISAGPNQKYVIYMMIDLHYNHCNNFTHKYQPHNIRLIITCTWIIWWYICVLININIFFVDQIQSSNLQLLVSKQSIQYVKNNHINIINQLITYVIVINKISHGVQFWPVASPYQHYNY